MAEMIDLRQKYDESYSRIQSLMSGQNLLLTNTFQSKPVFDIKFVMESHNI